MAVFDLVKRMVMDTAGFDLICNPAITMELQAMAGYIAGFHRQNGAIGQYQINLDVEIVAFGQSSFVLGVLTHLHSVKQLTT